MFGILVRQMVRGIMRSLFGFRYGTARAWRRPISPFGTFVPRRRVRGATRVLGLVALIWLAREIVRMFRGSSNSATPV